jgi:hypothetical protein
MKAKCRGCGGTFLVQLKYGVCGRCRETLFETLIKSLQAIDDVLLGLGIKKVK